jgi:translation elongation factor EF-4
MEGIRNFVIISYVDHEKSTLADRLLELTKTVPQGKIKRKRENKDSPQDFLEIFKG